MTYNFYPKRPVKSFQDLEVYQKLLAVSVAVAKRIKNQNTSDGNSKAVKTPRGCAKYSPEVEEIVGKLHQVALDLPIKIATAHSLRFSDQLKAINTLEEVMLGCNLLIVYLEQYRDIENKDIEIEFFDEQIKTILSTRFKILHLQYSWKKFMKEPKDA